MVVALVVVVALAAMGLWFYAWAVASCRSNAGLPDQCIDIDASVSQPPSPRSDLDVTASSADGAFLP